MKIVRNEILRLNGHEPRDYTEELANRLLDHYLKLAEEAYGYTVTITIPAGTPRDLESLVSTYDYRKHNGVTMRHTESEKQVFSQNKDLTNKALEGAAARANGSEALVKVKKEKSQDHLLKAKSAELIKLKNAFSTLANTFREKTEDMRTNPATDPQELVSIDEKVKLQEKLLKETRTCINEAFKIQHRKTTQKSHCRLQLAATTIKKNTK